MNRSRAFMPPGTVPPRVSAPPPFGGNQKTVIIKVNPERVRDCNLSPDDIVQALVKSNSISPAGNVRVGDETLISSQNTVVEDIKELENVCKLPYISGH